MARKQPARLTWPLTPSQVESLDEMLYELYKRDGGTASDPSSSLHATATVPPGIDGLDGEDGIMGPQGLPGTAGATGATGAAGTQGLRGIPGTDGEDIDAWIVPGPQGIVGPTGPTGPQGLIGLPGADGEDADTWPSPASMAGAAAEKLTGSTLAVNVKNASINSITPNGQLVISGTSATAWGALLVSDTAVGGGAFSVTTFNGAAGNAVAGDSLFANTIGHFILSPNAATKKVKLIGGAWTGTVGLTVADGGAINFGAYGAGVINSDASGNLTAVSDIRLKEAITPFSPGLREVLALQTISYRHTRDSGLDTTNTYAGFSAQQVLPLIPQAIGQNAAGYYTFNDRPVLAAAINAVRELQDEIDVLRATLGLPVFNRTVPPTTGRLIRHHPIKETR